MGGKTTDTNGKTGPQNSLCGVFFIPGTSAAVWGGGGAAATQKSLSIKPTPVVADKVIRHHVTFTSPHQHVSMCVDSPDL